MTEIDMDIDIPFILDNGMQFNDITSRQIGTLRSIDENRFDHDNISDKNIENLETLRALKLINKFSILTPSGNTAIKFANALGGSKERRRAATIDDVKIDENDIYKGDYVNRIKHPWET